MLLKYDLHIHTALSPCCHNDMTPNNIIRMAFLNNLKIIGITDHNSCENVKAVMDLGKEYSILTVPGMEIETKEEIHVLCFFSNLHNVYNMQKYIQDHMTVNQNNPKLLGEQLIFDKYDNIIKTEKRLLLTATGLSINKIYLKTTELGGVMVPAHIDRPSYSIISNLGLIPEDLNIKNLEISRHVTREAYIEKYKNYNILQSSDAHELGYIGICEGVLDIEEFTIESIINQLSR
ncbi:hypothetical protein EDC18_10841 [Natranaerovirga pectinivora]|uniref:Polymerase/histidinol phosphatase N-terminal domain-containing protein n=1 Tax=Natranaerovirga pectinivora TaxID=682400 RepID=A0A4R3MK78_9FIRM|nr:PHP domain-containing protein [Natranaerovirga pectinivora]TCT13806.1 hypothetical protein EDC18_10841 [Natranaerovirga pectinivora]